MTLLAAALALAVLTVSAFESAEAPVRGAQATPAAIAELARTVAPRDSRIRRTTLTIGHSARGRPINAVAVNGVAPDRPVGRDSPLILAIGCIHGDECAGISAVRRAYFCRRPSGADLIAVRNLNPDGLAFGTRLNARGVDLNRNFAAEHSGPTPFSEPEARLARRLIRELRPDVTIWFHQQEERLVRAWGPSVPAARAYARLAGEPFVRMPWIDGSAPNWQHKRFPGTSSFVVELPLDGSADPAKHGSAIDELGLGL